MAIIQGSSAIATPAKQKGLFGIHHMISTKRKNLGGLHLFCDAFSGSGLNHIEGEEIQGSPITILSAVTKSFLSFRDQPPTYLPAFVFSDITASRSMEMLPENVAAWQSSNGLQVDPQNLIVSTRHGDYVMPIHYRGESAEQLLVRIGLFLDQPNRTATITIDPNGPKDIPYDALKQLWKTYGKRLTLIFHVGATHLKRVAGAREAGINFRPLPDHLTGLIELFMSQPRGWIRSPVGADQWTIVMLTHFETAYGWEKQGYHKLTTPIGQQVLSDLSLTNAQKRAA